MSELLSIIYWGWQKQCLKRHRLRKFVSTFWTCQMIVVLCIYKCSIEYQLHNWDIFIITEPIIYITALKSISILHLSI